MEEGQRSWCDSECALMKAGEMMKRANRSKSSPIKGGLCMMVEFCSIDNKVGFVGKLKSEVS